MTESLVVAGGCFWGVEELIRKVPGVIDSDVGYTGGTTDHPKYDQVKTGRTGHAEAIRIDFDPKTVTREELLHLFFKLHDPTTLNRQGHDVGSQYRSTIFVQTEDERTLAQKVIEDVNRSGRWTRPVVTTIEPLKIFYPAEDYHQDYLLKNPGGYTCHFWRE